MAKTLLIAFDASDLAMSGGFLQALGGSADALLLTGSAGPAVGVDRVLAAGLSEVPTADAVAKSIAGAAAGYSHIVTPASMRGKDLLARVAGILDAAMVTDAVAVESPTRFVRLMVAGSILATVEASGEPICVTFRPSNFGKVSGDATPESESISLNLESKSRRVSVSSRGGTRPDLAQAKVVVSGGRPLGDAATFEKVIGGLADALGGAVGATRAAVDNGIAANELQVGQTGKIVAPDLYIAAGISGSTQHMAGIKDSKVIVAINKDPDAPIFEMADFGLVADLFDAVPALEAKVKG